MISNAFYKQIKTSRNYKQFLKNLSKNAASFCVPEPKLVFFIFRSLDFFLSCERNRSKKNKIITAANQRSKLKLYLPLTTIFSISRSKLFLSLFIFIKRLEAFNAMTKSVLSSGKMFFYLFQRG